MTKNKVFIGAGFFVIVVILVSFGLITSKGKAQVGVPQTTDALQIQEVIKKSYELEALAGRNFDLSSFQDVFINDPRGGVLSSNTIGFVNDVTTEPKKPSYGYLDYKIAYYSWWKNGATKIEGLQAKAEKENRPSLSKDELNSLVDNKGRMAMGRMQGNYVPSNLVFSSIDIQGEVAVAIFDDGPRTNQMTLVKVNNKWLIAGDIFLSIHP